MSWRKGHAWLRELDVECSRVFGENERGNMSRLANATMTVVADSPNWTSAEPDVCSWVLFQTKQDQTKPGSEHGGLGCWWINQWGQTAGAGSWDAGMETTWGHEDGLTWLTWHAWRWA